MKDDFAICITLIWTSFCPDSLLSKEQMPHCAQKRQTESQLHILRKKWGWCKTSIFESLRWPLTLTPLFYGIDATMHARKGTKTQFIYIYVFERSDTVILLFFQFWESAITPDSHALVVRDGCHNACIKRCKPTVYQGSVSSGRTERLSNSAFPGLGICHHPLL